MYEDGKFKITPTYSLANFSVFNIPQEIVLIQGKAFDHKGEGKLHVVIRPHYALIIIIYLLSLLLIFKLLGFVVLPGIRIKEVLIVFPIIISILSGVMIYNVT